MKWMLVFAAACGGGSSPAASGSGSGSAVAVAVPVKPEEPDLCELGRESLKVLTDCNGQPMAAAAQKAKQQFDSVLAMVKKTSGSGPALQMTCAQMLFALDGELVKSGCKLPLSAHARDHMFDLVETWRATRTPVAPTGNAAADVVIGKIVEIRDTACKCTTDLCLDGVQKSLDHITPFAADAPEVARTLGNNLLDDVSRCSARVTAPIKRD